MADPQHPLMPYLHVPMQAGCDRTLERMKRRYNLEEMEQFFDRATRSVPDLCVGTDLMVGFPGKRSRILRKPVPHFSRVHTPIAMYLLIRKERAPLRQNLMSRCRWMSDEKEVPTCAGFPHRNGWIFMPNISAGK